MRSAKEITEPSDLESRFIENMGQIGRLLSQQPEYQTNHFPGIYHFKLEKIQWPVDEEFLKILEEKKLTPEEITEIEISCWCGPFIQEINLTLCTRAKFDLPPTFHFHFSNQGLSSAEISVLPHYFQKIDGRKSFQTGSPSPEVKLREDTLRLAWFNN